MWIIPIPIGKIKNEIILYMEVSLLKKLILMLSITFLVFFTGTCSANRSNMGGHVEAFDFLAVAPDWTGDVNAALASAKENRENVLILYTAPLLMKQSGKYSPMAIPLKIVQEQEFKTAVKGKYRLVFINQKKINTMPTIKQRFSLSTTIPVWIFLHSNANEIYRIIKIPGNVEEVLGWLKTVDKLQLEKTAKQ